MCAKILVDGRRDFQDCRAWDHLQRGTNNPGCAPTPLYLNPLYYIFNIVTVTGIMNISTEGAQLTSWPYRYYIIENHTSLLSPFSLQALNAVNLISQYQEDTGTKVTFV